jgi:hypothetical protein
MSKKYDFSGYATRNDLACSDGRTIKQDAFKEQDGLVVPLVWQHIHNEPTNILGHALLENRKDGVYVYCTFNNSEQGKVAKELVSHGDITALSIWANQLKQQGNNVMHGAIREVSLVLTGANPGAFIDNLNFAHSDGTYTKDDDEAIIYSGLDLVVGELEHADPEPEKIEEIKHADPEPSKIDPEPEKTDKKIEDILKTLNDEQQLAVAALISAAMSDEDLEATHSDKGGNEMKRNVFDSEGKVVGVSNTLTHQQWSTIVADTKNYGGSFKDSFLAHAGEYGIENIDFLFPDAATLTPTPSFITREMGWVSGVLAGTHHSPFSRIKSVHADITADEARAKGYIKGNLKVEEFIKLSKRITGPKTIYKKQKLDRDDLIDITDLDVVAWLKMEMRMMLDEEIARAILIGDGRAADSLDKITEENVRPIYTDADLYAHHVEVAADIATKDLVDLFVTARVNYKGSGNPKLYTTTGNLTSMLLLKDTLGRRLYNTKADLASALLVADIVEVPVMDGVTRTVGEGLDEKVMTLVGIVVNLKDYNIGADKGGAVNMFDDFDIDYNQFKYLIETRISGALTMIKSALVIEKLPAVV